MSHNYDLPKYRRYSSDIDLNLFPVLWKWGTTKSFLCSQPSRDLCLSLGRLYCCSSLCFQGEVSIFYYSSAATWVSPHFTQGNFEVLTSLLGVGTKHNRKQESWQIRPIHAFNKRLRFFRTESVEAQTSSWCFSFELDLDMNWRGIKIPTRSISALLPASSQFHS